MRDKIVKNWLFKYHLSILKWLNYDFEVHPVRCLILFIKHWLEGIK